jgi:hypothetical protein
MQYADGQTIKLGDQVKLGGNASGVVVACIESGKFSEGYPRAEWE